MVVSSSVLATVPLTYWTKSTGKAIFLRERLQTQTSHTSEQLVYAFSNRYCKRIKEIKVQNLLKSQNQINVHLNIYVDIQIFKLNSYQFVTHCQKPFCSVTIFRNIISTFSNIYFKKFCTELRFYKNQTFAVLNQSGCIVTLINQISKYTILLHKQSRRYSAILPSLNLHVPEQILYHAIQIYLTTVYSRYFETL